GGRVADVDGIGVSALLARDVLEALGSQLESLVPAALLEIIAASTQRPGQHVLVFAQHFHALALGADEAAAQGIVLVAADVDDLALRRIDRHQYAAACFADGAFAGVPAQTAFQLDCAHGHSLCACSLKNRSNLPGWPL